MKAREKMAWCIIAAMVLAALIYVTTDRSWDYSKTVEPQPIKFVAGIAFQKQPGVDRWNRIE